MSQNYWTICCGLNFKGLKQAPEEQGVCKNCGKKYGGATLTEPKKKPKIILRKCGCDKTKRN